ncbi:Phosphodiest-domain-containing protein [Thelephora ganbajun]|uniref:Phosphodiest-domain-containing protein n=1 Tax=Thelephora ganbajun TaxID=370292 RepID=A0ACB6Z8V0_THEGA|nr:Phosphodiest-domain-containing protein [Thelephora ganbajun]
MSHSFKGTPVPSYSQYGPSKSTLREREGLSSNFDVEGYDNSEPPHYEDEEYTRSRERVSLRKSTIARVARGCVALILGASFLMPISRIWRSRMGATSRLTDPSRLLSNGTHEFRRTVLIVSIDGLRVDYLDRGFTPHLLDISERGLRAKFMRPVFPTVTFPNHWSLMTGLYAESHGIVANNFWDPVSEREFNPYNTRAGSLDSFWWLGEPMWETAGKAGMITANLMWPSPPITRTGAKPTYSVPLEEPVPLGEKLDRILAWIDLPLETRPQFISAYEPSVDIAGHNTGPYSQLVNDTLMTVDLFAKDLRDALKTRNLTEIINVVFVSDHGMADTSHPEWVYIDDYLGKRALEFIEHEDGWPSMGLRFSPEANTTAYLNILLEAAKNNSEKFDVYTHETMPERYHYSHTPRIAPIYIIPKYGYALTTRDRGESGMKKGLCPQNHGYDNRDFRMQAMFIAHGPFSDVAKALHRQSWIPNKNEGWHSTSDNVYVIDAFQNVEVYNLVMKLLDVPKNLWAKTNGTVGFWDRYF